MTRYAAILFFTPRCPLVVPIGENSRFSQNNWKHFHLIMFLPFFGGYRPGEILNIVPFSPAEYLILSATVNLILSF